MIMSPREDKLLHLTRGLRDALSAADGYACLLADDLNDDGREAANDVDQIREAVKQALSTVAELEQLVEVERRAASRDPLTQVPNRHALNELGERMFLEGAQFSLFMIDVDHFKAVNDTYGHASGDAVLVAVAERCRAALRDSDVLARLAGDEFVALLPNAEPDVTARVAERLATSVAVEPINTQKGHVPVTISLGAATRSPQDATFKEVVARADDAMYAAKRAGRNRVAAG